jgi:glutaredoxin
MTKLPKIQGDFALLDVLRGRRSLARYIEKKGGKTQIPVVIRGHITRIWGHDDGTSQEFEVVVTLIETEEPP